MKKDGGTIKNWQTHTLEASDFALEKAKEEHPDFNMDALKVFTGTVVEDPTGRFEVGFHMRSSLILNYDKDTGKCETVNTIYTLTGEEGGDIFNDIGISVLGVYY